MKAIFSCLAAAGVLFVLAGCGNSENDTGSIDSIDAGQVMETSSSPAESQSVFTGTIESITKVEAEEETIQIKVTGVKSKEDPANIGTSFSNDGVLLNAAPEQIREGADALKSGVEITFTLVKMPVMTMSIPPQIPGDSIIEITVNK